MRALSALLKQPYSNDICRQILAHTGRLFKQDQPFRWYFLLLNRVFAQVLEHPDLYDADISTPIIETLRSQALKGVDAAASRDLHAVIASANQITEAYGVLP